MNAIRLTSAVLGTACLMLTAACNESTAQAEGAAGSAQVAKTSAARTPREVCTDEVVTRQKPVKDKDRILGTVAGALIGGVVGNEVGGKGTGGDIATVGGAAAGGYAGNRVQKSVQKNATVQTTERVCRTVYD
jgi:uncharacterized protein YcfJ